jgi:hypothetical protein
MSHTPPFVPLDLRLPIGGLLSGLGLLLAGYGMATRGDRLLYAASGGSNINLLWGVVMLGCGLAALTLSLWSRRRGARAARGHSPTDAAAHHFSADDSGAGRP